MVERVYLGVRIGGVGMDWLDTLAEDQSVATGFDISRSDVTRAALAVAKRHEAEVITAIRTTKAQI